MTTNPHDRLFKAVFSDAANVAAHLEACLPPAIVSALDLSRTEHVPGSWVDDALREHCSDLLFHIPLRCQQAQTSPLPGTEAGQTPGTLLYVLFEHQSTVDPRMPLRVLRYLLALKHGRGENLRRAIFEWEEDFRFEAARGDRGLHNIRLIVEYVLVVSEAVKVEDLTEALRPMGTEAQEISRSTGRRLVEQGKEEGLKEAVLAALEERFGAVPPAVEQAVLAVTDPGLLSQLLRQAVKVPTLEALEAVLRERDRSPDR